MGQSARLEEQHHNQTFAMAPGSCTCRSPYVNTLANPARELNELAGQGPARQSNTKSDEALIKASISLEAPTPPLIPPISEDLSTKFIKMFMKTTQAKDQLEP